MKTRQVSAADLRKHQAAVLNYVKNGFGDYIITSHGAAVARISPVTNLTEEEEDEVDIGLALEGLRKMQLPGRAIDWEDVKERMDQLLDAAADAL